MWTTSIHLLLLVLPFYAYSITSNLRITIAVGALTLAGHGATSQLLVSGFWAQELQLELYHLPAPLKWISGISWPPGAVVFLKPRDKLLPATKARAAELCHRAGIDTRLDAALSDRQNCR